MADETPYHPDEYQRLMDLADARGEIAMLRAAAVIQASQSVMASIRIDASGRGASVARGALADLGDALGRPTGGRAA